MNNTSSHKKTQPETPLSRTLVIAIDGLDWKLLNRLVDSGEMPFCRQLVEAGSSAIMNVPPPVCSAAAWSSIATGVMADQHGVCHDLSIRPDGLTLHPTPSQALKSPSFWQLAMKAGLVANVAGWPVTLPAVLPPDAVAGSRIVSSGFEIADNGSDDCWPLSPEVLAPLSERATVQEARLHPADLQKDMVAHVLSQSCRQVGPQLINAAGRQLAQLASVHNLGVHWAQQADWQLLALRFDQLKALLTALKQHRVDSVEGLTPWYRYLDMMIGRYMGIVGRSTHIVLISDHGFSPQNATSVEQLFSVCSSGFMIAAGPKIPVDQLLDPISGLDIAPTVLSLLSLQVPDGLSGRDIFTQCANTLPKETPAASSTSEIIALDSLIPETEVDEEAIDWLTEQGFPVPDLMPLKAQVAKIQAETIAGWAYAQYARGNLASATNALEQALQFAPEHLGLRLALGERLLEAGKEADCQLLVEGLPTIAKEGLWSDVINSLLAIAAKNWSEAEYHLERLAKAADSPINSFEWLGQVKIAQRDWITAVGYFQKAMSGPGNQAVLWDGQGFAQIKLGKYSEALQSYHQAIAERPTNAVYHQRRALAYEQLGELLLAQRDLWRALTLDPALNSARYQLVQVTQKIIDKPSV